MTTISTYLAASLVAVTFGWVPSERAGESQPSEGYDYLVKLSPEDLEALRDGRAVDLVSELPDDIGPINRVRVYVGEGAAPQELRARDLQSPQRIIAAESQAKRYEVAKPVTPEWKDASLLETDEAQEGDTAERHTTYQNPSALQEGFAQATRPLAEVGQVIDSQAKNLADNTAQLFQRGGDELRRGVQNLANGAGNTLESLVPGGATAPYSNRPTYDQPSTVQPPETADPLTNPQQAQYTAPFSSPALTQQNNQPTYQQNPPSQSDNAFTSPPLTRGYDQPSSSGLVTRYAETDQYGATNRVMTPVDRGGSTTSDFGASQPRSAAQTNVWDPFPSSPSSNNSPQTPARTDSAFPELRSADNSNFSSTSPSASFYNDGFGAPTTQTGGGFASDRPATNPPANSGGTSSGATAWGGAGASPAASAGQNPTTTTYVERDDRWQFVDRVITVVLAGGMVFTWIAYIDVRNKYLSSLRAAPGSGYSNAA